YDTSWKEINRIELSKLIAEGDMVLCADISEDGNTLALSTFDGLYSHDIASETTTRIVDCAAGVQADGLELVGMERISFTDNSHIAFLGGGWALPVAQGVQSETLYGTLATDGSGLTFKKPSGYSIGEELFVRGGKLFLPENFTKADGKLLTVDLNSGKETIYPLSYGGEGKDGVYVSDKGGAFATAALGGSELVVRVYDNNGNLMKTETLGNFDEFQLARTPVILLLEDSRTCIVLTGTRQDDINTGVTTFNY
ncbi:MAG: hypothetical protein LBV27_10030, partial [Oscillospiraceae bacterium]|nr:hypothetical protein [Oscillospiraceae bacterium]